VHPFASVTVTENVDAVVTVMLDDVAVVDQLYAEYDMVVLNEVLAPGQKDNAPVITGTGDGAIVVATLADEEQLLPSVTRTE